MVSLGSHDSKEPPLIRHHRPAASQPPPSTSEQHEVVLLQEVAQYADDASEGLPAVPLGQLVDQVAVVRRVVKVGERLEHRLRALDVTQIVPAIRGSFGSH